MSIPSAIVDLVTASNILKPGNPSTPTGRKFNKRCTIPTGNVTLGRKEALVRPERVTYRLRINLSSWAPPFF